MEKVEITGRIIREGGMFIAQCDEIEQTTWNTTLETVACDVVRLVIDYFHAHRSNGSYQEELQRLGLTSPVVGDVLKISIHLDLSTVVAPNTFFDVDDLAA